MGHLPDRFHFDPVMRVAHGDLLDYLERNLSFNSHRHHGCVAPKLLYKDSRKQIDLRTSLVRYLISNVLLKEDERTEMYLDATRSRNLYLLRRNDLPNQYVH